VKVLVSKVSRKPDIVDGTNPIADRTTPPPSQRSQKPDDGNADAILSMENAVKGGRLLAVKGVSVVNKEGYMIDTGASLCMSNTKEAFIEGSYRRWGGKYVYLGDDSPVEIAGVGDCLIQITPTEKRRVEGVLHVPSLADNLLSITHLLKDTQDMAIFTGDSAHLYLANSNKIVELGRRRGNLYYMSIKSVENGKMVLRVVKSRTRAKNQRARSDDRQGPSKRIPYLLWHSRLGHASEARVIELLQTLKISYDFSKDSTECAICKRVNPKRLPYSGTATRPKKMLQKMCEDTFELAPPTPDGYRWCSYVICAARYKRWLVYTKRKSEICDEIIKLFKTIEIVHNSLIESVQSDNGELNDGKFKAYCEAHEPNVIEWRPSPPHTQALNGFVERHIGIDRAKAACLLAQANLPATFIKYALDYTAYISYLMPVPTIGMTPMEAVTGTKPTTSDMKLLKLFGCLCFAYVPKQIRKKRIEAYTKAEPGLFLGYQGKGIIRMWKYRTKAVHVEYHVGYCEREFPGLELSEKHLNPLLNPVLWDETQEEENDATPDATEQNAIPDDEILGQDSDSGGDAKGEFYDGVIELLHDEGKGQHLEKGTFPRELNQRYV
jgi:hypothetical protein